MAPEQALHALTALLLILGGYAVLAAVNRRRQFLQELRRRTGQPLTGPVPLWGSGVARLRKIAREFPVAEEVGIWGLEVAARMRAGASPDASWAGVWESRPEDPYLGMGEDGSPLNLEALLDRKAPRFRSRDEDLARGAVGALVQASRFSQSVGAPLAPVLETMTESITQSTRALAAQKQAFTGPRLSAYVLAGLPLVGLLGGELVGAGTLSWLFGSLIGRVALLAGGVCLAAGFLSSNRLIDGAQGQVEGEIEATLLCDLARSGLKVGISIPSVLRALGHARRDPELVRVAAELVMDANWHEAWVDGPENSALLQKALQPAWEEGLSPLLLLEHTAATRREAMVAQAEESAAKLGVQLVVPLGLFLLPAFILLGILPVAFAILEGQLLF